MGESDNSIPGKWEIARGSDEVAAAREYADINANSMADHDLVYNAFLAGMDYQKGRFHEPEKEYYGF